MTIFFIASASAQPLHRYVHARYAALVVRFAPESAVDG
jgi:hypothetical protein